MAKKQILGHSDLLVSSQTGAIALLVVFATQSQRPELDPQRPRQKPSLILSTGFQRWESRNRRMAGACQLANPA